MEQNSTAGQLAPDHLLAGRYRVQSLIGRGGMAEVYQARDERLARPVALKLLRPNYAHDPVLRVRFEEEARAAAMVSHPNVIAVYDAGEEDGRAFIVMELVTGATLAERIASGPLSPSFVRPISIEVLDALAAAHARGVLHRDIKPANVLLTEDGHAKVADFGIAKAVHPSPDGNEPTAMNIVFGTPSYLAPERAQGHRATASSDLWAVGVMMYEMLTAVKPFEGSTPLEITLAAQQGRYVSLADRLPESDPALAAVIERAMNPDPTERFVSAEAMAHAIRDSGPVELTTAPMTVGGVASTGVLPLVAAGAALGGGAAAAAAASPTVPASFAGPPPPGPGRRRGKRPAIAAVAAAAVVAVTLAGLALAAGHPSHLGHSHHQVATTTTGPKLTASTPTTAAPTTTLAPTTTTTTTTTTVPPTTKPAPPTTKPAPPTTTPSTTVPPTTTPPTTLPPTTTSPTTASPPAPPTTTSSATGTALRAPASHPHRV